MLWKTGFRFSKRNCFIFGSMLGYLPIFLIFSIMYFSESITNENRMPSFTAILESLVFAISGGLAGFVFYFSFKFMKLDFAYRYLGTKKFSRNSDQHSNRNK